jgi:hypothetical protein
MPGSSPHRISIGPGDEPPPPLAGALAAWLLREGAAVRIVEPRGGPVDWTGAGPLHVHLEVGFDAARLDGLPGGGSPRFFGPATDDAAVRGALTDRWSQATFAVGDPEPVAARIEQLDRLPITSWAGFGAVGGTFRVLAGRGDRFRSPGHLLREVVYLAETFGAGHLMFDDADLAAWGEALGRFEAELLRLPWAITWEGSVAGVRRAGPGAGRLSSPR